MGQNNIDQLLTRAHDRSCLAFTDGLCLGNPGPYGPGAVDYVPDDQMGLDLTRPGALFFFPFNIRASIKLEQYARECWF